MKRISEIIADIQHKYPNDDFFSDFENSCRVELTKRKYYHAYNKSLMLLDNDSWQILKDKAIQHYRVHREGQKKQGTALYQNPAQNNTTLAHILHSSYSAGFEGLSRPLREIGLKDFIISLSISLSRANTFAFFFGAHPCL